MTNDATQRRAGETHAGINPNTGRNPRPTPPTRRATPALPDPVTAFDLLERIQEIAIHRESLIDSTLEAHICRANIHPEPLQPLPDWAVERLKDQGRAHALDEEFRNKMRLLKDWLHLAAGDGSQYRYEVWTGRGERLSFRHESWAEAAAVLEKLKPMHPGACVCQVHVTAARPPVDCKPELLNTLLGAISHIGTWFGEGGSGDLIAVQDATGRQVMAPAETLRQHPVYERLEKHGKDYVEWYMARQANKGTEP
ncbi:hypothetical protein [Delftia tsuruhatensis]|uniref:Uncharacterized protein n=1 Tax=Delftia tsuruhatensis TaxID=180282 RepID=A0ABM6E5R6_9BURK|nr:hypothetical protein [Delftia tsuruhatensis]AOV02782.1 hypothetical protein BI380_16260 [Delftia tsuruhatensis]